MTMPSYVSLKHPSVDAFRKYENHPSIVFIKKKIRYTQAFEFQPASYLDIVNEISGLGSSKKTSSTLSVDYIIKNITGICLLKYLNTSTQCSFPVNSLILPKAVYVSATHKGFDPTLKIN